MTPQEVAALLAYVARLDPRLAALSEAEAEAQLDQWCTLLDDVPSTAPHPAGRPWDASQAARHHIATSPYPIKPSDVSRPWHAFKADVVSRHHDPVPAADPDDPEAYRAALADTRQAVALGALPATTYRELTGGSREEREQAAEQRLAAIGGGVPRTVRDALAPYRPRKADRERLAVEGRPDPYDVPCGYCRARTGEACRNHRRAPRKTAHPSRVDDAHTAGVTA